MAGRPGPRPSRAATAVSLVLALASSRAGAERPELVRIGSIAPEGTAWAGPDCFGAVVRTLERVSQKPVRVRTILGAALGDERSQLERVRKGTLDGYGGGLVSLARFVPELAALTLPFLYDDDADVDAVMASAAAEQARSLARAAGFELLVLTEAGWRGFGARRPLRAPADFQGLSVRSSESPEQLEMWRLLGARPRPLPVTETLSALETHVVEGFDQTPVFMFAASWYAHSPYYVYARHLYEPGMLVLATRTTTRLGLRPEAFREIGPRCMPAARAEGAAVLAELRRSGSQVLELSPEERRVLSERVAAPVRAYFRKHTTPAGRRLLDAIERALAAHRKGQP